MLAQVVSVWCSAIGGHHHRNNDLAPFGVLRADHHTIAHRGMLDEHVLDLGGGNDLPAPDDRVVGTAADEQVAALVQHGNVFGGEPSVGVEHRTDLGIASSHLLATHEQLTVAARLEDGAVLAADLHLDSGYRVSDRSEPPHG